MSTIEMKVNSFKTKYEKGFTPSELEELLKQFPKLNRPQFNDAMNGCTGLIIDGDFVLYHYDIIKAIDVGTRGFNLRIYEWD
jgi:hypothetical protein